MSRYKVITQRDKDEKIQKRRNKIYYAVDGGYLSLLLIGILVCGLNQLNANIVGWGLIVMGMISIPVTLFHIWSLNNGWTLPSKRPLIQKTSDNEAIAVIVILAAASVAFIVLGILKLIGVV